MTANDPTGLEEELNPQVESYLDSISDTAWEDLSPEEQTLRQIQISGAGSSELNSQGRKMDIVDVPPRPGGSAVGSMSGVNSIRARLMEFDRKLANILNAAVKEVNENCGRGFVLVVSLDRAFTDGPRFWLNTANGVINEHNIALNRAIGGAMANSINKITLGQVHPIREAAAHYRGNNPDYRTNALYSRWVNEASGWVFAGAGIGAAGLKAASVLGVSQVGNATSRQEFMLQLRADLYRIPVDFTKPWKSTKTILTGPSRPVKPISVQKQARHAGDWAEGVDPKALIQEAYQKGVLFKGRADSIIYETGRVVGKNGETQVIVRVAEKNIHGHPAAKVLLND
jgi:hypothetical protein